jgi:hypothetical protein
MQQHETQCGLWGYWWRMLVVGGVAGGSGAMGILLSCLALRQPLLSVWQRVLIGGVALEVLLMSLLALAFLRVHWTARAAASSAQPLASSCDETTQRPLLPEATGPRLWPIQIVQ